MPIAQTRRRFLTTLSLAGAVGILPPQRAWAGEPPLETTTVRFGKLPVICFAPQYVCEALLRAEGFTDVRYVDTKFQTQQEELGRGKLDFQSNLAHDHAIAIDRGVPISVVAGVHAGCYELFAHGDIRGLADLKGKRVGGSDSRWLTLIAAYVGLDPKNDLNLIDDPAAKPLELFAEGKLDAYLTAPPQAQELHAQGRTCYSEERYGQALVAVFLLYASGKPGICRPKPSGDQACDPSRPESRRSVRRQARTGSKVDRRGRLH